MKRIFAITFICLLTCFLNKSLAYENGTYKVIKVIDGDTLFLDFNNDGRYQQEEKVRINGIDTFEVKPSVFLDWQMKEFSLTQSEALGMGYFGKEFAKKNLLNKYVKAQYSGNTKLCDMGRQLMSIYYDNGRNYEQEVLKAGLAIVYKKSNLAPELYKYENLDKVKANVQKTHWLNLVLLNKKNNTYHKVNCQYGLMASNVELINKPLISKYKSSDYCYHKLFKLHKSVKMEKLVPDVTTENVEIYYINGYKYKKPSQVSRTSASQALIREINNAKTSIDFAIYGIDGQLAIHEALVKAQNRGVKVRWVTDMDEFGKNIYFDTTKLMEDIKTVKTDYNPSELQNIPDYKYKLAYQGALMHNKFFIFDNQKVFTGSTNISSSCIGGYNINVAVLINSKEVASLYKKEFEQMYNGKFHQLKQLIQKDKNIKLDNKTIISVYFLPKDEDVSEDIITLINNSKNYIYIPMFYLTDDKLIESLISAKKKGVDVRIILDATCATGYFTKHKYIREHGIPLKVENWGGKLHSKSAIIDDEYAVIGSMNWTKQGGNKNDENLVIIKNSDIAKSYKKLFLYQWKIIPNKYLKKDPKPEGPESIHSCNDGLDNDHDGKTDSADEDCHYFKLKSKMAK